MNLIKLFFYFLAISAPVGICIKFYEEYTKNGLSSLTLFLLFIIVYFVVLTVIYFRRIHIIGNWIGDLIKALVGASATIFAFGFITLFAADYIGNGWALILSIFLSGILVFFLLKRGGIDLITSFFEKRKYKKLKEAEDADKRYKRSEDAICLKTESGREYNAKVTRFLSFSKEMTGNSITTTEIANKEELSPSQLLSFNKSLNSSCGDKNFNFHYLLNPGVQTGKLKILDGKEYTFAIIGDILTLKEKESDKGEDFIRVK